jgi:hypothetical protein
MALLTHTRGPRERAVYSSAQRAADGAEAAAAGLAPVKRVCLYAATALLAGTLAGIIALKTAIYFWRFKHFDARRAQDRADSGRLNRYSIESTVRPRRGAWRIR